MQSPVHRAKYTADRQTDTQERTREKINKMKSETYEMLFHMNKEKTKQGKRILWFKCSLHPPINDFHCGGIERWVPFGKLLNHEGFTFINALAPYKSAMVEHILSMHEVLGSVHSPEEEEGEGKGGEREREREIEREREREGERRVLGSTSTCEDTAEMP
jgi:hypothetical protein